MKIFYILDYLNGELIRVTSDKGIHKIFDTLGLKETNCEWMEIDEPKEKSIEF